jgi:phosphate-selective porin OprO/OprP
MKHRRIGLGALALLLLPAVASANFADDVEYKNDGFDLSLNRGLKYQLHENVEFRLGGRLHLDSYGFDNDVTDLGDDNFDVRRGRLFGQLTLFDDWRIKVEGELSDYHIDRQGMRNVWLDYTGFDRTDLRLGNQIAPMSLEELISSNELTFMERSLANAFSPGFLTGLAGRYSGKEHWTVAGGVFFEPMGDQETDKRKADGVSVVARGSWAPYYKKKGRRVLHLGASIEYRSINDDLRFRSRPEAGSANRLVSTGTLTSVDDLLTFGLEAAGVWGPFSVQGEYLRATGFQGGSSVAFDGGYVQLAWTVTGERRRYSKGSRGSGILRGVRPKRDWGAIELAARYSAIDLNDGSSIVGGDEQNVTLGVNWYLTRKIRAMFNYVWADARLRQTKQKDQPQIFQFRLQFTI